MKGQINKIWDNGENKPIVFEIDGEKYSSFDRKLLELFNEGDTVEFEFVQKGQYKNIKTIEKLAEEFKEGSDISNRSLQIIRQACLKAAVELKEVETSEDAIIVAEKFVKYVLN